MKNKEKNKKDKQSIAAVISAVIIIITLLALIVCIIYLAVRKGNVFGYTDIPSITDKVDNTEETADVIPEIQLSDQANTPQTQKADKEINVEEYTHDLSAKVEDVKIERETKEKPNE